MHMFCEVEATDTEHTEAASAFLLFVKYPASYMREACVGYRRWKNSGARPLAPRPQCYLRRTRAPSHALYVCMLRKVQRTDVHSQIIEDCSKVAQPIRFCTVSMYAPERTDHRPMTLPTHGQRVRRQPQKFARRPADRPTINLSLQYSGRMSTKESKLTEWPDLTGIDDQIPVTVQIVRMQMRCNGKPLGRNSLIISG